METVGTGSDIGEEADPERDSDTGIDAVDALLDEVEAALVRLDDGSYGRCARCGSPIEDDRLAAAPTSPTCAACARAAPA